MKKFTRRTKLMMTLLALNCGLTSAYADLTVSRGERQNFGQVLATGDFNGDGKLSLVVGSPERFYQPGSDYFKYIEGAGSITVISDFNNPNYATHRKEISQRGAIAGAPENHDEFGGSLAVGDFNHDGYDDLAVGVPGEDIGNIEYSGAVNVIYGSSSGLSATHNKFWSGNNTLGVARAFDSFGMALATGDFNNDDFDDLAIGVPGRNGSVGEVVILTGTRSGLAARELPKSQDSRGIIGASEYGDKFGYSLISGDFDHDGYDDLAIGVPGEDIGNISNAGAVNILFGSYANLTATNNQFWSQDSDYIKGSSEAYDLFGYSLAVGDFNGDKYDDLAIGVPGEDIGSIISAGAVNVLYGGRNSGLSYRDNEFWSQNTYQTVGVAEAFDNFGKVLTTGDFNNDEFDELVVGVPHERKTPEDTCFLWIIACGLSDEYDEGAVNVFYGSLYGLEAFSSENWHQDAYGIEGVSEVLDRFGSALVSGDFNNDGNIDLAIGVPGEDDGTGYVNLIFGTYDGLKYYNNKLIMHNN